MDFKTILTSSALLLSSLTASAFKSVVCEKIEHPGAPGVYFVKTTFTIGRDGYARRKQVEKGPNHENKSWVTASNDSCSLHKTDDGDLQSVTCIPRLYTERAGLYSDGKGGFKSSISNDSSASGLFEEDSFTAEQCKVVE